MQATTPFLKGIEIKEHGVDAVPAIRKIDPQVFLVVTRSCNGNAMVYRATKEEVQAHWLDLDPKTRRQARAKGRKHDVDTVKFYEQAGYGFTERRTTEGRFVTVRSLPQCVLKIKQYRKSNGKEGFLATGMLNKQLCTIISVHVNVTVSYGVKVQVHDATVTGFTKDASGKKRVVTQIFKP